MPPDLMALKINQVATTKKPPPPKTLMEVFAEEAEQEAKHFPKSAAPAAKPRPKKDGGNSRTAEVDGGWLVSGVTWVRLADIETVSVRQAGTDVFEVNYGLRSGRATVGRLGTRDEAYAEAEMVIAAIKEA